MSHDDLVERAVRWLKNSRRCPVVLSEVSAFAPTGSNGKIEMADAIGWSPSWVSVTAGERPHGWRNTELSVCSVLVECKVSRTDWYADRSKVFRKQPELGMGQERWFLTPRGLIDPSRQKLLPGWGLLEVRGRIVKRVVEPTPQPCCLDAERSLLLAAVRRQHIRLEGKKPPEGSKEPVE